MNTLNEHKLKITVVVNGKFHAFDYAAELNRQGKLHRLISSMPYSVAQKYGISKELFVGLPVFELLKVLPRKIFKTEFPARLYAKLFTKSALNFIPADSDVIITSAGCSEEIYRSKKIKHIPKILDRGSTHTLSNIRYNKLAAQYHHTLWKQHPQKFLKRELIEYELADKILVPSSFVKQSFTENGIEESKMIQIPYGLSNHKFAGLTNTVKEREPAVLFVGQISARKGVGVLIKAVELVRESMPQVKLWLVGARNKAIDSSLFDKPWVEYCGVLRGQELYTRYMSASVFCLTSFEEGLALVLTEAVQCGLPIVATENTGAADIITNGETGFVVPVGDPAAVAEKLLTILNDRKSWEFKVKNAVKKEFTWEGFCNQLVLNIESLLETTEADTIQD